MREAMKDPKMAERYCALLLGLLFLFIGFAGFTPSFAWMPDGSAPISAVDAGDAANNLYSTGFGYVFGLFPTNIVHNFVHCLVGFVGIIMSTDWRSARAFNRGFAIAYAFIALLGLLPFSNTVFGLMPIFGNNVWFNALTAAIAAFFGFAKPASEETSATA
jgi:Domain of unknown function (DUF4383)